MPESRLTAVLGSLREENSMRRVVLRGGAIRVEGVEYRSFGLTGHVGETVEIEYFATPGPAEIFVSLQTGEKFTADRAARTSKTSAA